MEDGEDIAGKITHLITVIILGVCGVVMTSFCTFFKIFQVFYHNYVLFHSGGKSNSPKLHKELGLGLGRLGEMIPSPLFKPSYQYILLCLL